jgi:hypothetical protein
VSVEGINKIAHLFARGRGNLTCCAPVAPSVVAALPLSFRVCVVHFSAFASCGCGKKLRSSAPSAGEGSGVLFRRCSNLHSTFVTPSTANRHSALHICHAIDSKQTLCVTHLSRHRQQTGTHNKHIISTKISARIIKT